MCRNQTDIIIANTNVGVKFILIFSKNRYKNGVVSSTTNQFLIRWGWYIVK